MFGFQLERKWASFIYTSPDATDGYANDQTCNTQLIFV